MAFQARRDNATKTKYIMKSERFSFFSFILFFLLAFDILSEMSHFPEHCATT